MYETVLDGENRIIRTLSHGAVSSRMPSTIQKPRANGVWVGQMVRRRPFARFYAVQTTFVRSTIVQDDGGEHGKSINYSLGVC